MIPRIDVVGLGPGDPSLVTPATRAVIDAAHVRYVRTFQHPSVEVVGDADSFDHIYDRADTFDEVYRAIADQLLSVAATEGSVLYAVPGSPLVLERTVEYLRVQDQVQVVVHPALSFLDVAWARLGIDPVDAGVTLVDGHRFAEVAPTTSGPALVAHCHNQRVLSDIKLSALEAPDADVVVLQSLGTADEQMFTLRWWDLDRLVDADHLTSLYVPEMPRSVQASFGRLVDVVSRLRVDCPWDRAQTHGSLRRHLVEETHEVLDALDLHVEAEAADDATGLDSADEALQEELGDLLFQAIIHAVIADQEGRFGPADVADGIHDKLVARHPHVFGGAGPVDADELVVRWEADKVAEKGRDSVFDGIPAGLPALSLGRKVLRKAAVLGVDVTVPDPAPADSTVLGETLLRLVAAATAAHLDAEDALREAARRVRDRVRAAETGGGDLSELSIFES